MSAALRPSCACPSVSLSPIGRPSALTRACILVVRPPRERPMQRDRPSFFGVGGVLVNADRGGIDHLDVALVSRSYRCQYPRPMARLAPAVEAVYAGRVRPEAQRYIRPRRPCPQPPEYPVQDPAIIHTRPPANLRWQQRLDRRPLKIRQIKACHNQTPFKEHWIRTYTPWESCLWVCDLALGGAQGSGKDTRR